MNRFALALWLLAGPAFIDPASAQPAEADESIPAPPAGAPPQPADLKDTQAPASPVRPGKPVLEVLPAGLEPLPGGGARLRFAAGAEALPQAAGNSLTELGRRLAAGPPGRVTLTGQTSGPVADVSAARRQSLARALAVKEALAAGGLPPTRIDIRPMGRTAEALDVVDVQPPEPPPAR